MTQRLIAGCMTGTSLDALDAALVRVEGTGPSMHARFIRGATRPLGALAGPLRALAEQAPRSAGAIAALARELALLHAGTLRDLAGHDRVDLVAVHGQTVFHAPPVSWQLMNPAPIARALGAPVVFDLRAADLAAGGQGAPITPIADWVMFGRRGERTAVVNLGGFCNVTLLPADDAPSAIRGRDVCPCNHLLDAIARELFGSVFDAGGERAASGVVHAVARDDLAARLRAATRAGRSLGTGDEDTAWLGRWRGAATPEALAATACDAIAGEIARAVDGADTLLIAGGGAKNRALSAAIARHARARVEPTDARGVPATYREAAAMAVLGALCQDRVPITLPSVTGVPDPAPVAGFWTYP